ncbi:MAG: Ig-like domain-containing protein [candidate division KSB1 bacterium]|nr:Ig-like domain-containing protein [candidate division KSB1 bacterium]
MRSFKNRVGGAFLMFSLIGGLAGCDSQSPNAAQQPAGVQPTLASIQANIFNLKCAVAGCHLTSGIAPMSLESGLSFNTLVNVPSNYGSLLRVKPNDALNSVLYLKVIGDPQVGGAQARMPFALGPMPSNEVNAIRDWINAGALPDAGGGPVNRVRIIRPNNSTVQVGGTLDLDAQAFDANNNVVAAIFSWSSSAPTVATVNPNSGVVTGVSIGAATITATAAGKSDSIGVTVVPAPALQATLSSIQANIFTPKCVNAGCHPGGGAPMSLQSGASFGTLVGVNSAYGRPRVAPGNANNSALYLKAIGDVATGARMPLAGPPLSQAETDSIRAWINRGAQNN